VEPCLFSEGNSFYDQYGEISFDLMFHGFDYPDELGKDELYARFWRPKIVNGIIEFIRPEDCTVRKFVKSMSAKTIGSVGLDEDGLLDGYPGEVVAR
jgi:CRISPR-associated protein Cas5d